MSFRVNNIALSEYFLPRVSAPRPDTSLRESGIDVSEIYETLGTDTKRSDVNIRANGIDISNLFKPNPAPFTLTQLVTSDRNLLDNGTWTNAIQHEFTLLWVSNQAANEFFERAGEVRLDFTISDSLNANGNVISATSTRNSLWKTLDNFVGTVTIKNNEITKGGTSPSSISGLGWANIAYPSSPVVFYQRVVSTSTSYNDFIRYEISKPQSPGNESNTARRLTIKISFHDTTSGVYDQPQDLQFFTAASVLYSTNLSAAPTAIETIELPAEVISATPEPTPPPEPTFTTTTLATTTTGYATGSANNPHPEADYWTRLLGHGYRIQWPTAQAAADFFANGGNIQSDLTLTSAVLDSSTDRWVPRIDEYGVITINDTNIVKSNSAGGHAIGNGVLSTQGWSNMPITTLPAGLQLEYEEYRPEYTVIRAATEPGFAVGYINFYYLKSDSRTLWVRVALQDNLEPNIAPPNTGLFQHDVTLLVPDTETAPTYYCPFMYFRPSKTHTF